MVQIVLQMAQIPPPEREVMDEVGDARFLVWVHGRDGFFRFLLGGFHLVGNLLDGFTEVGE